MPTASHVFLFALIFEFEAAGLTAFRADAVLRSGQDISTAIWEALAESRAVIVIFSPRPVPDAMGLVEIGAAAAWSKPVFVLFNGPSATELPSLSGVSDEPLRGGDSCGAFSIRTAR